MPGVFPDYLAPAIRNTDTGTEMTPMRWGMPPHRAQVVRRSTNIRNTNAHLRGEFTIIALVEETAKWACKPSSCYRLWAAHSEQVRLPKSR
jgi:putative SOS response-associated peptidase YedK